MDERACPYTAGTCKRNACNRSPFPCQGMALVEQSHTDRAEIERASQEGRSSQAPKDCQQCYEEGWREAVQSSGAAQASEPQSFEVRVAGPDDVYRYDSELAALRAANAINVSYWADCLAHPNNHVMHFAAVYSVPAPAITSSTPEASGE